MEKNVLVSVKGLQMAGDMSDAQVDIWDGTYFLKNNKHYISYIEKNQESQINNTLKICNYGDEPVVELIRRGSVDTHMIFRPGANNSSRYVTDYGTFLMGFNTRNVEIIEETDVIRLSIEYGLRIDDENISDNIIYIEIKSGEKK